jgi:preprotein translocase subunit SecG
MYAFISVLILLVCVILTLVVLVQNSKGGGLASNFSGSNQVMGVRKTADFLEKATWTLAGALLVLSVFASMAIPKSETVQQSRIQEQVENTEAPISPDMIPSLPSDLPSEGSSENDQ